MKANFKRSGNHVMQFKSISRFSIFLTIFQIWCSSSINHHSVKRSTRIHFGSSTSLEADQPVKSPTHRSPHVRVGGGQQVWMRTFALSHIVDRLIWGFCMEVSLIVSFLWKFAACVNPAAEGIRSGHLWFFGMQFVDLDWTRPMRLDLASRFFGENEADEARSGYLCSLSTKFVDPDWTGRTRQMRLDLAIPLFFEYDVCRSWLNEANEVRSGLPCSLGMKFVDLDRCADKFPSRIYPRHLGRKTKSGVSARCFVQSHAHGVSELDRDRRGS